MQEAVRKSGKLFQVGFVRRYDTNAQLLRAMADRGEFGEIYFAKASTLRRLGNPGGWFSDIERSGGGPLIDIGVHVIDLCWYMMGRPKPVSVSANTYRKLGNRSNVKNLSYYQAADYDASKNTVEDMANALIRFENGASLLVDVSFTLHAKSNESAVKLYGEKGGFEIDPETVIVTEQNDTILNVYPQTDNKGFDFAGAFQNEIDHFIDCVSNGRQPISPVEDGVEIMKILAGIYDSAAKGAEVRSMKLGISTYSLYNALNSGEMTIQEVIVYIASIGAEHAEIVPMGFNLTENPELIEIIKKQAEESGIELSNYAVGANFSGLNEEQYEQELARLKQEVDIAAALGVKKMRHDAASS